MKTRLSIVPLCLLALSVTTVASDTAGDAGKKCVLRVAERYRAMTTYDIRGETRMSIQSSAMREQVIEGKLHMAGVQPDLHFVETSGSPMMSSWSLIRQDSTWTYLVAMRQYTVKPASSAIGSQNGGTFGEYLMLGRKADGARLVREENVQTAAGERNCLVVVLPPDTMAVGEGTLTRADTMWVDAERDFVLKRVLGVSGITSMGEVSMLATVRMEAPELDRRPPDSLFVFTPPPGAMRVDEFAGTPAPAPTGQPAEPFTLADLAGRQVSLSEHRGKVVLLDFWATWCGPCRLEMPHVDALSRELAREGLMVFAITSESRELASDFLKKNGIGLRCLIDAGGKVFQAYQIEALPTVVVIDRDGKVSDVLVGLQTEASLRSAVRKAGIE
ncbi:MAG: redoxin domain-containing protein [Candidatus Krumholzibacteria bacterium]|nr:redoxin domain-containing protein [Candidatus Krumholzibacteria bacterium]MDH5270908.1 redoxin domain-containing protein [Candidatus Krumholzibacteria bacterium]